MAVLRKAESREERDAKRVEVTGEEAVVQLVVAVVVVVVEEEEECVDFEAVVVPGEAS